MLSYELQHIWREVKGETWPSSWRLVLDWQYAGICAFSYAWGMALKGRKMWYAEFLSAMCTFPETMVSWPTIIRSGTDGIWRKLLSEMPQSRRRDKICWTRFIGRAKSETRRALGGYKKQKGRRLKTEQNRKMRWGERWWNRNVVARMFEPTTLRALDALFYMGSFEAVTFRPLRINRALNGRNRGLCQRIPHRHIVASIPVLAFISYFQGL